MPKIATIDPDEFRRLYAEGVTLRAIAAQFGVSTDAVKAMRDRLGLPDRGSVARAEYRDPTRAEIEARKAALRAKWSPEKDMAKRNGWGSDGDAYAD